MHHLTSLYNLWSAIIVRVCTMSSPLPGEDDNDGDDVDDVIDDDDIIDDDDADQEQEKQEEQQRREVLGPSHLSLGYFALE